MPDRKRDAPLRMMFLSNLTAAVRALAEAALTCFHSAPPSSVPHTDTATPTARTPAPFAVPLVSPDTAEPSPAAAPPVAPVTRPAPGHYWRVRQDINTCSNHMWHSALPWSTIRNMLNIRYGTLMTAARAQLFRKPYTSPWNCH